MGDRLVITIHLPVAMDKVNTVLRALSDEWPKAVLETGHEDGWHIDVGPDDG